VTIKQKLFVNLIAVVLLAVVMVSWVVIRVVGGGPLENPFTVTAEFASSGGVFTDQEVTYRGFRIGSVGDLTLSDDGVHVPLQIDPEWEDKIPADVTARILSKSAVGEQYVDLAPRSEGGATLVDGSVIPRSRTKLPVDFQALLDTLDRVLGDIPPETAHRVLHTLGKGLRGRGEDIASILKSLNTLSGAFASVAPQQQRLLSNATKAGSAFLATKDEFSAAIKAADKVFAGIGDEPGELKALFASNDRFAREASALLKRKGDDLGRGINALGDLVDFQLNNLGEVGKSLKYLPQFLHAIEDSSVPWRSPDGRRFYRIRAGLVLDNVRATWPCKYESPLHWERMPHVRDPRPTLTDSACEPPTPPDTPTPKVAAALVDALRDIAGNSTGAGVFDLSATDHLNPNAESVGFEWPIDGVITSPFGPRGGSFHEGLDIDGETGDPIGASAAGTVIMAAPFSGYGNAVILDHGHGVTTLYGHMSAFAVTEGDKVSQGQILGAVGSTGHSTGSHLHFEIRVNGTPIDPLPYLPGGALYLMTPIGVEATPAPVSPSTQVAAPAETTPEESTVDLDEGPLGIPSFP
jgi:phospholipid/cholesterol/gamma-HCH transport system substrate-binding protein